MSFFDQIQTGIVRKPLFLALHTTPGVGKTSFAASFPDPFFFDFEESTHMINVKRKKNMPESFQEIMNDLDEIYHKAEITEFKTIVFDTIDEMERLIHWQVAAEEKKSNIKKVGWQRGYDYAVDYWAKFISKCRLIRDKHQINFIFLAHTQIRNITSPDVEATYTKSIMGLHPKAADYIFGQVEMVLFAKKEIAIKSVDEKNYVKDLGTRLIYTEANAGYDAKNRIGLPATMPMVYGEAYSVLMAAYDKAINETSDSVYKECVELISKLPDTERESIANYCTNNKNNKVILKFCLEKIKTKIGESKDEQSS